MTEAILWFAATILLVCGATQATGFVGILCFGGAAGICGLLGMAAFVDGVEEELE